MGWCLRGDEKRQYLWVEEGQNKVSPKGPKTSFPTLEFGERLSQLFPEIDDKTFLNFGVNTICRISGQKYVVKNYVGI